jgi:hypothetical protein
MNDAFAMAALAAVLWLAVALALLRTMRHSPALTMTGSATLVYFAVLAAALVAPVRIAFWPFSAAYAFLALCVLMPFGALYKSVSLRMLGDLSRTAGQALPEQQLLARYIEEDSFGRRVDILLAQGYAEREAGKLRLSAKGRRIAAGIHVLQRAFAIRTSG